MAKWNWQNPDWPHFKYTRNPAALCEEFLYKQGKINGMLQGKNHVLHDLIRDEAISTSAIEGELLNRDSVHSSICKALDYPRDGKRAGMGPIRPREKNISLLLIDVYKNPQQKISEFLLKEWHKLLCAERHDLEIIGDYRKHQSPMQIVGNTFDYDPEIYFEAPPSDRMQSEMALFINNLEGSQADALTMAAIAHLYFVCIHPFEDGNGRIARALTLQMLANFTKSPTILPLSSLIQKNKRQYYDLLAANNTHLNIQTWIDYFVNLLCESQDIAIAQIEYVVFKTKLLDAVKAKLNPRQLKTLIKMLDAGIDGFAGGMNIDKYLKITKTSRATATRDLADMVNQNILIKTGQLKGTRYYLNKKYVKNN